jgi:hypothetical protein
MTPRGEEPRFHDQRGFAVSSVSSRRVLGVVGAVLGTTAIITFVLTVYLRIRDGRGMEVYRNVYQQNITWVTAACSLIAVALVLAGSYVVRWLYLWRRSRLEGISMKEIAKELKQSASERERSFDDYPKI